MVYPTIYRVSTIQGDAGLLPSFPSTIWLQKAQSHSCFTHKAGLLARYSNKRLRQDSSTADPKSNNQTKRCWINRLSFSKLCTRMRFLFLARFISAFWQHSFWVSDSLSISLDTGLSGIDKLSSRCLRGPWERAKRHSENWRAVHTENQFKKPSKTYPKYVFPYGGIHTWSYLENSRKHLSIQQRYHWPVENLCAVQVMI